MVRLSDIRASTAEYFGMSERNLVDPALLPHLAAARHVGMYVCREMTGRPLLMIAQTFNRTDHTTARHGIKKVASALESGNEAVALVVTAIRQSAMQRAASRSVLLLEHKPNGEPYALHD